GWAGGGQAAVRGRAASAGGGAGRGPGGRGRGGLIGGPPWGGAVRPVVRRCSVGGGGADDPQHFGGALAGVGGQVRHRAGVLDGRSEERRVGQGGSSG